MGVCAACGRENPPDAKFCNECGAGLVAAPAPRQQRKTVTMLFCDVTGSTALGERLDPESFRQVMRHYFEVARRVIERHGGTVEKFIGDAVLAVFGVPVLHGDDALRAVRAATDLRTEIAGLNTTLTARFNASISIRTGVNTGQVITGTVERLATGDAVNLAARLEQAAAPGEIVIGEQTWRLVRDAVTAEPLEPLKLKGKTHPVAAYRVLQVASAAEPRARPKAPLVGRHSQLRLLGDVFANVVRERSCTLFTLVGTAGVGKSRLAAEFLGGIDAQLVTARCLPYGDGITYWPVLSIVRQLLDPQRGSSQAAELMASDAKVGAAIKVLLGEQFAMTSPEEIAWAVRRLFEAAAVVTPLVVLFDDLHWAEPALLDLIEHVADFTRDAPILELCLARPELLDRRAGWGGGKLNVATVLLEPLNAAETAALIDELAAAGELGLGPRKQVQTTSAGNPLFVEEILALMQESGSAEVVMPPTIEALLAARLDQLPPHERTVLECGAVEGESFHRGPVQALASDEPDVGAQLMTLVRKDLIRPDRAVLAGEEAFRFRHLLIRDAAYEALAKADRAELHETFAHWLEQHGTGLVELDEIVGYHLEQAHRYRIELGPADDKARGLAAEAAVHLQAAGLRAIDRGDTAAAVTLLERAEALLPPQQINLALQEKLIHGLAMSGRLEDAVSRAARTATECSAVGDWIGELRARLLESIWAVSVDPVGQFGQLSDWVARARPAIQPSGDPAAMAVLEYAAAVTEFTRSQYAAAYAAFTRAMEHARKAGDLWFENRISGQAAGCLTFGPTSIGEVLKWLEQAKVQSSTYQPNFDMFMVRMLAQTGRFDEARSLLAQAQAKMNERGLVLSIARSKETAWETELLAGDIEAAERVARQGCEQLERLGDHDRLSTQACLLADALYALGRYHEARHWAQRGLEIGNEDDLATQLPGLSVRSRLLARHGDTTAALALARQVEELAKNSDSPIFQGNAALNLAEVLYLASDKAGAQDAVHRAVACYERKGATAYVARAQRLAAGWAAKEAN